MGKFIFKELRVWEKSISFAELAITLTENLNTPRNHFRLIEQFEAASASISMNIAEGKGRRSKKEFIQYLYIARGSLYEVVTLATIFQRKYWITTDELNKLEAEAEIIGSMIKALINSIAKDI